jgi:RNA polymerase sigma-70 factor, ECF subfamily
MDDFDAIEQCRKGDSEAFRFLVERYQSQALVHAMAIMRNREDASDAVQEAFVDAFRALARFDKTRTFYPWFYVLLRNRCYKAIAAKKETISFDDIEVANGSGLAAEGRLSLERALKQLPAEGREIISLKYLDGLSYDEIGLRLEIPKGTVMSRLFYARKEMLRLLTGKRLHEL